MVIKPNHPNDSYYMSHRPPGKVQDRPPIVLVPPRRQPALPPPVPPPARSVAPSGNTALNSIAQTFLDEHNKVRQTYGVSPLVWNPDLIGPAQRVTDTCVFKHTTNNPLGENIAAGQTSPQEVVFQWVNGPEEKSLWNPQNPIDSHFTQVVWEDSLELGCAVTTCTTMAGVSLPQSPILFWACEYNPPGNVETLYVKNVHAAAGGAPLA